jgi:hypothetical protein
LAGGFSFDFVGALTWATAGKSTPAVPNNTRAASTMTEQAVARTMTRPLERVERPVVNAINFSPWNQRRPASGLAHCGEG